MVSHLRHIDVDLASRVADGLALSPMPPAPPTAAPARDSELSPAPQIIGKMKDTLEGRAVGILINDGSDGKLVAALTTAAVDAGATVKIVAPKAGGTKLADGKMMAADGQLAGTPSVMFDDVAVILSADGATRLFNESAAIAIDAGGQSLVQHAGLTPDAGVVQASDTSTFIARARTRQWAREASVRTLA